MDDPREMLDADSASVSRRKWWRSHTARRPRVRRESSDGPVLPARSGDQSGGGDGVPIGQAQGAVDPALRTLARSLIVEQGGRPDVLQPEAFRHALEIERCRADRLGTQLSVLLLAFDEGRRSSEAAIESLRRDLRSVDSISPLGRDLVAALLPHTGRDGGKVAVDRFLRREGSEGTAYRIIVYPDDAWAMLPGGDPQDGNGIPLGEVDAEVYPVGKRMLDVGLAGLGLLLLTPVMLFLAGWLKLSSPAPILFRQTRVGLRGRLFELLKFRTMRMDVQTKDVHREHARFFIENDAPMPKAPLPLIPGGALIRGLCLDELPQLVNVLRGEMSLVGPRPCLPCEADAYRQWHWRRFSLMPGLTGLWQVSGKNRLTFNQMVRLDLRYAREFSWMSDFAILFRTPAAIVTELVLSARGHRPN